MGPILIALDRDGTLIEDRGYLGSRASWKRQVKFRPWVHEGLEQLASLGDAMIVVATNQSGVARGYFGLNVVNDINQYLDERIRAHCGRIDKWLSCPYISEDDATREHVSRDGNPFVLPIGHPLLELRKPRIGMLRQAAFLHQSALSQSMKLEDYKGRIYTIGDKETDQLFGVNANGVGILIEYERDEVTQEHEPLPQGNRIRLPDLVSAAEWIKLDAQAK